MRNRIITLGVALATALTVALLTTMLSPVEGQAQGYKAPRTADGKPDLNGIWESLTTANWDIQDHPAAPGPFPHLLGAWGAQPAGLGIVEGNEIPYKPAALAKKKENQASAIKVDPFNLKIGDPEAKCYMPGVPRANYMPFPFQIIQGTDKILIAYEFDHASRIVYMSNVGESPVDVWMGHSIGRWEGDTLVIDVSSNMEETWFDRAGNYHSGDMRVTERWTRTGPDHLQYEATINDPNVFTRPWKVSFPLYRRVEKNVQINEFRCVEFAEPYLLGTLTNPPLK